MAKGIEFQYNTFLEFVKHLKFFCHHVSCLQHACPLDDPLSKSTPDDICTTGIKSHTAQT